jgi:hypothetical protein
MRMIEVHRSGQVAGFPFCSLAICCINERLAASDLSVNVDLFHGIRGWISMMRRQIVAALLDFIWILL